MSTNITSSDLFAKIISEKIGLEDLLEKSQGESKPDFKTLNLPSAFLSNDFHFKEATSDTDYCNTILHSIDFEELLSKLISTLGFDATTLYLPIDESGKELNLKIAIGFPREYCTDTYKVFIGHGFGGAAAFLNKIRLTEDAGTDSRFIRKQIAELGFKGFVSIPLCHEGKAFGLINFAKRTKGNFSPIEIEFFSFISNQLGYSISKTLMLSKTQKSEQLAKHFNALDEELLAIKDLNTLCRVVIEETRILLRSNASLIIPFNDDFKKEPLHFSVGIEENTFNIDVIHDLYKSLQDKEFFIATKNEATAPIKKFLEKNHCDILICLALSTGEENPGLLCTIVRMPYYLKDHISTIGRLQKQISNAVSRYLNTQHIKTIAVLEEQNRLSRELHDSLAQQLVVMSNQSKYIQLMLAKGELRSIDDELQFLTEICDQATTELREVILGLRIITPQSEHLNFEDSVKKYVNFFKTNREIEISLNMTENLQLPFSLQIQLTRILQEALTNVRKHSKAYKVDISIELNDDMLEMSIADNGIGFNIEDLENNNLESCGLSIMRERIENLGGTFSIYSKKRIGTKINTKINKHIFENLG